MYLLLLNSVKDFLDGLPTSESARIIAHLKSLENNETGGLVIKTLKGKIKEIIVKQYRLVFFTASQQIYVVDAFRKKSQKTPKRIIEKAEKVYLKLRK